MITKKNLNDVQIENISTGLRINLPKAMRENFVTLYDMFGHRIAKLEVFNGVVFWNKKSEGNRGVTSGVYFLRSGSQILGKFMYSPNY
jgi:hypothetical protein